MQLIIIYESETVNCNANCTHDGQWKLGSNVSGFASPSPNVRKAWRHTCQIARFWIKITVSFLMPLKFTLTNKCSLFDRFYVCMYMHILNDEGNVYKVITDPINAFITGLQLVKNAKLKNS